MLILVCDDDASRAASWRDEIRGTIVAREPEGTEVVVRCLPPATLSNALSDLASRQAAARTDDEAPATGALADIDRADILVIDHDLTPTRESSATDALLGRSGEGVAMLARRFTTTGFIVLVNKVYQSSTFDLTMTKFQDSFADLNITDQDLDRASLWAGDRDGDRRFRPSHWPLLLTEPQRLSSIASALDLDAPVLKTLGLSDDVDSFTFDQLDALGDSPEDTSFRAIAHQPALGLGLKDKQPNEAVLSRIAVFAVSRWLRDVVLPGQNVILDLPHLLERVPALRSGIVDIDALSPSTLLRVDPPITAVPGLADTRVSAALSPASAWVGRAVWNWSRVSADSLDTDESDDLVYCEDVTALHHIDAAREFESAVAGPYVQRYVRFLNEEGDRVSYLPRGRLLR